jgi:hypothetical protein
MFFVGLAVGLVVGGNLGVILIALFKINRRG